MGDSSAQQAVDAVGLLGQACADVGAALEDGDRDMVRRAIMAARCVREAAILAAGDVGICRPGWERAAFVRLDRCAHHATRRLPTRARERARDQTQNLWVAWAEAVLELRARVDAVQSGIDEPYRPR